MSANAQDYDFGEYDKPGAERSRRRRGENDDLESDLEEELLEDDWLSGKKNPSEVSDEELNDDLLQSDDDDMGGQDLSVNATYNMDTSYDQQDNLQEADYTDDIVNLGAEGCEEGDVGQGGYQEEEYTEEYSQDNNAGMPEDQMDYTGELAEGEDGYQDEVLDIQINEPLDGEFQGNEYQTSYDDEPLDEHGVQQEVAPEEMGGEEQQEEEEEDAAEGSQVFDTEEVENEAIPEEATKEESDEEDEEDEESGRIRFKSERKDGAVVRLADAGSNRRNIPETLELSEKAKQDLREFEEQERQKRQNRYGGRGRGGGGGGARGNRGRGGFPGFGMGDFRGGHRGRMNDQRPLIGNIGMQQPSSRMPPPHQSHQQQMHSQQHHHPSRPRGPPPFQEHGRPLSQPPLQPLIPLHMAHRSPPMRPQMEPPPRMMSSPPPNFPQHHQQQPPQPKNIHINPHFRGPTSSSVQVPLMPPAQSQPRPAVGPQRFPGPGDFQQHMPGNFGQPQRPPHHMEPFRNQDREPLFMTERTESTRFPGQHMFDHQGHSPLMNSGNNLHQQQQMPGPGHMGFGPPGPAFNQPGQGPLGLFPREPPRPNHPPHQGHQGMVGMNQQGGPPNQPRPFMGPRQPFGQQGSLFPPPPVQFGMQVRLRGLMHAPPVSQLPHHDSLPPHQPMHHHQQQQQQHHRQELPHHHHHQQQQQLNLGEPRPMMHHAQNPFHQQQAHGSPRQMTPRPLNPQQRNMSNRQRMNAPVSKQMQQRNSNLRELPVAPGNTNMNSARIASSPAANVRPVAKATQGVRPGQNTQPVSDRGRGRGQVAARTEFQPGGGGRTVVRKEIPSAPPQDPNEDEETRQYRLKIEEQKRLREEILRRKEMRRQMQAGVRKKELLERLNSQTNTQVEGPTPTLIQPAQQNQQKPHPVQQRQHPPPQLQQQPEQTQLQQLQPQPQRQFPQRTPQPLNQSLNNPNQGNPIPPNGAAQPLTPRPNVKTRLQMVKGSTPQPQIPGPVPNQQWNQPPQNQLQLQQRRSSGPQNVNRPGGQIQKNIPVIPVVGSGQAQELAQSQGPKPGAKRTVMQRAKNSVDEGQQVPQKVRVVKLSGANEKGPEATGGQAQQQGNWPATATNQGVQRKVTMAGQQQQGPGGTPQAGRGGIGNQQQNRVVVSGRGRGRAGGQMGRGRPVPTRQSQRVGKGECCTVSIEGLSSSTTDAQLMNLLRSIGPIEMFKMMPQQRKAVATFSSAQHAESFQISFHRHMIDLSHIDVSLIDG
ncbi:RNA-binding protein 33 isoform X1 [Paralichthys olivaceus]|uniref:RNA-binding protein 33 isoform X1 n=1 Tax=Paralichthys olivaceus TaxID=8255 RepID=UPI0037511173